MGWAKYHEDIVRTQERRGAFDGLIPYGADQGIVPLTTLPLANRKPTFSCPYCKAYFPNRDLMCEHIKNDHAGFYSVLLLNKKIVKETYIKVNSIDSLKLLNYGNDSMCVSVWINGESNIEQNKVEARYGNFDISSILHRRVVHDVDIQIKEGRTGRILKIECQLDIKKANSREIYAGCWKSDYFMEQISMQLFSLSEYRKFLTILAYEKDEETISMLMMDIEPRLNELDKNKDQTEDFLLYYTLISGEGQLAIFERYFPQSEAYAYSLLLDLLALKVPDELEPMEHREISYLCAGTFLLHAYLADNTIDIAYFNSIYRRYGILGNIITAIEAIFSCDINHITALLDAPCASIKYLNLRKYPLLEGIISVYLAAKSGVELDENAYKYFNAKSPTVCAIKIMQTTDKKLQAKLAKAALKRFDSQEWFFEFARRYIDDTWSDTRIGLQTPELYWGYVEKINAELSIPLSKEILDHARNANKIEVVALGDAQRAGCSCFVVSTGGYNILLDAGVGHAPNHGTFYPDYSKWENNIDAIVISHAHMDHAGSVAIAHSMWPDAPIITTHGTKSMLEPFLYDIAFEKGEIDEEDFKFIEKNVAADTYQAILACDFGQWIWLSDSVGIRLHAAGHLLGAAMVELSIAGSTVLYTGDFCMQNYDMAGQAKLINLPKRPDLLICEATYLHSDKENNLASQKEQLMDEVCSAIIKNKTVLMPCSALGRSQEVLCLINNLKKEGRVNSQTPVFVGGFAAKICDSVTPAAKSEYQKMLETCYPLSENDVPDINSIIIASSGSMRKRSASFQIAEEILKRSRKELCILSGEELDSAAYSSIRGVEIKSCPMRTHANRKDIWDLIGQLSPYSLALVHWGESREEKRLELTRDIYRKFRGGILTISMHNTTPADIWNLKDQIMREESLKNE